jgi:hypothetical protein
MGFGPGHDVECGIYMADYFEYTIHCRRLHSPLLAPAFQTVLAANLAESRLQISGHAVSLHSRNPIFSSVRGPCPGSMVRDVFSLHSIVADEELRFPFSLKDYQRYIFGDDRLAHRLGTDLAKAYIPTLSSPIDDLAVAVLSERVPTATHSLRDHFVAYLNRHLIANNATPALKLDFHHVGAATAKLARDGPSSASTTIYHIDTHRLQNRTLIVLADIRTGQDREDRIRSSFAVQGITTVFAYLASLDASATTVALSNFLSSVVSPSIKDIEAITQGPHFVMNECFVKFIMGRDDVEFCQFIRRQDDHFTRLLLDHAINSHYYDDNEYQDNLRFLLWEVQARESV